MQLKALLAALALVFAPLAARAVNCPGYSYILTNGQVADANQVMSNFNTIMNCANNVLAPASSLTGFAPLNSPVFTNGITVSSGTANLGTTVVTGATTLNALTTINAALQVNGFAQANTLAVNNGASGANLQLIGTPGSSRQIIMQSGGSIRWIARADGSTEGGSNTGSNYVIIRYDDTSTSIDSPLNISRQTGIVTMGDGLVVAGPPTQYDNSTRAVNSAWVQALTATIANPGIAPLATAGQAMAGTDATHATTPASLAGAQSLAANGYIQFPGQLNLEWGQSGSIAGGGGSQAINFVHACASTVQCHHHAGRRAQACADQSPASTGDAAPHWLVRKV